MSKLQHTPKSWILTRDGWNGQYIHGNDDRVINKKRFIAEISLDYDGSEANASLIATAPEMLESLIAVCNKYKQAYPITWYQLNDTQEIIKVIEKATGLSIEDVLE